MKLSIRDPISFERASGEKRLSQLSVETCKVIEQVRSSRILELENWRGLRLELDKLKYLVEKLTRELSRMREARDRRVS